MVSGFLIARTNCQHCPLTSTALTQSGVTATPWSNEVTLRSVEHMIEFEPAGWVPYVAPIPLMMIVGRLDVCTFPELQLDVFATAREPKRLVMHPCRHFKTDTRHVAETIPAAIEWFAHLA